MPIVVLRFSLIFSKGLVFTVKRDDQLTTTAQHHRRTDQAAVTMVGRQRVWNIFHTQLNEDDPGIPQALAVFDHEHNLLEGDVALRGTLVSMITQVNAQWNSSELVPTTLSLKHE